MELNLIKGKYERPAVAVSGEREEFCNKIRGTLELLKMNFEILS